MKTCSSRLPWISLAVCGGLLFAACSPQERDQARAKAKDTYASASEGVKEAYAETKAAMSNAWREAKSLSFEQRDKFSAQAAVLAAEAEAQVSRVRADYSEAKASASRQAAVAELRSAEADYKRKVAALGDASAATWDSAKLNVIAAWDRLQAAYHRARAE